jgi:ABC-type glycerol-3-phosphate transport system substrate-binding protein
MYGVPIDYNSLVWYVNLDHLSARGVECPSNAWNTNDLRDVARKLTDPVNRVYGTYNRVVSGVHSLQWTQLWTGQDWVSDDRTKATVSLSSVENSSMPKIAMISCNSLYRCRSCCTPRATL